MPGGRPRKIREVEFCLCCLERRIINKGYNRKVVSWTPDYKSTTRNYYWRFRHDDRKFFCTKCGMNECYVDKQFKKEYERNVQKHPLGDLIKEIAQWEDVAFKYSKILGKLKNSDKTWKIAHEDQKKYAIPFKVLQKQLSLVRIIVDVLEIKIDFLFSGKKIPLKMKKALHKIENDAVNLITQYDNSYKVSSTKTIKEMHTKYTKPYLIQKKKITRAKQSEGAFGSTKWDP